MKKIVSFAFAALLAVTSYSVAAETTNKAEEVAPEKASVVEKTETKAPKAEKVQPNAPVASNAEAKTQPARRAYTRQEIRSMNILDRPNRPGHFYGNAVRRRHGRY